MVRRLIALLSVAILGTSAATAADPPKADDTRKAVETHQINLRQFQEFEAQLIRLATRLERSGRPEDRERAANLKKAIALAAEENVDSRFEKLIDILKTSKTLTTSDVDRAIAENHDLAEDLRAILNLLLIDNRDDEIRREKERIANLIKMIEKALRDEKLIRAHTEGDRMEKKPLADLQEKAAGDLGQIAKQMGKGESDKKGTPTKGSKGGGGQPGDKTEDKKGKKGAGDEEDDGKAQEGTPGRKQVQDAKRLEGQAAEDIQKEQKDEASAKQSKAIKELEKARQKLEEILRQLREEEIQRLLARLQARCEEMLAMQVAVYQGTKQVAQTVTEHVDKKPERVDEQKSLQLSDREGDIIKKANQAIELLEAEGSAVAFPEVFYQVRDDMGNVQRRLSKVDVGEVTQVIEQDIIQTLKEMIDALKKQRQDMEARKSQPPSGPPPPQKLIELLAELKMIRAMQVRVNNRTVTYARQYVSKDGEQAGDPDIRRELRNLSERQLKIYDVTNNLYRGKNK